MKWKLVSGLVVVGVIAGLIGALFYFFHAGEPKWVMVLTGEEETILIERFVPGKTQNKTWLAVDGADGRLLATRLLTGPLASDCRQYKGVAAGHLFCADFEDRLFSLDPRSLDVVLDDQALREAASSAAGLSEVRRIGLSGGALVATTATADTIRLEQLPGGKVTLNTPRPAGRRRLAGNQVKKKLTRYLGGKKATPTGLEFIQATLIYDTVDLAIVSANREVDRPETIQVTGVNEAGKVAWEVPGESLGMSAGAFLHAHAIGDDIILVGAGLPTSAGPVDRLLNNTYIIIARVARTTGQVRWISSL